MYIRVWSKKKNGPFQRSTTKTIPTPASSGFLQQASRQAGKQMPRLQLPAIPCVATDNNSRLRLLGDPRGIVRLPAYVTCSRELLAHTIVKRAVTIHIASDTTYPPL